MSNDITIILGVVVEKQIFLPYCFRILMILNLIHINNQQKKP